MATNIVMADSPIQVKANCMGGMGKIEHWIGITYTDRHGKEQYLALFGTPEQLQQIAITIRTEVPDTWHRFPKAFRCRCGTAVEECDGWLCGNQVRCDACYRAEVLWQSS